MTEFTFDIKAEAVALRKENLKQARESAKQSIKKMKLRLPFVKALAETGFITDYLCDSAVKYGRQIKVTKEQLPLVKRVLMSCGLDKEQSRLTDTKNYSLRSTVDRKIHVYLECKALDDIGIKFYFEDILPADATCRIERQYYDALVCDNK